MQVSFQLELLVVILDHTLKARWDILLKCVVISVVILSLLKDFDVLSKLFFLLS